MPRRSRISGTSSSVSQYASSGIPLSRIFIRFLRGLLEAGLNQFLVAGLQDPHLVSLLLQDQSGLLGPHADYAERVTGLLLRKRLRELLGVKAVLSQGSDR